VEKRLRFIRSPNPFAGLDDYLIAEELRVNNRQIEYPLQLSFDGFGSSFPDQGMKKKSGYYFELLMQGIYGGRLKGLYQLLNNPHAPLDVLLSCNAVTSEPDLVIDKKSCLRESKSVSPGGGLKIEDEQMAKYLCLQLNEYFQNPPKIIFEIFRHGVRKLVKNFKQKPLEELVSALSNPRFLLSIPLSIILEIHRVGENHSSEYTYRYEDNGGKYDSYSQLLSSGLNAILAYPKEALSRFGLNPNNYNIWKLKFPEGVTMNGKNITPFPVLLIRDKNHGEWFDNFREKGPEFHPRLFERKSQIEKREKKLKKILDIKFPGNLFGQI